MMHKMKTRIYICLSVWILFFNGQLHSQEHVHVGLCKFEFSNFKSANPTFSIIDQNLTSDMDAISKFLKIKVDTMFQQISFVKGQELMAGSQYYLCHYIPNLDLRKIDRENYVNCFPKYEFLFKVALLQSGVDYYFSILTDSTGSVTGDCLLPNIRNTGYPTITKVIAENLVIGRWKTTREISHVRFAYHFRKNCFVWILTKPMERPRKSYLLTIQYIVVNAHNGKVIEDKLENITM